MASFDQKFENFKHLKNGRKSKEITGGPNEALRTLDHPKWAARARPPNSGILKSTKFAVGTPQALSRPGLGSFCTKAWDMNPPFSGTVPIAKPSKDRGQTTQDEEKRQTYE